MAIPFPLIQGVAHDHSSLDVKLDGVSCLGIKAIDWEESLNPGKLYGTSAQKMAETRGQQDASGSMELWKQYATDFELQLTTAHPGQGLGEIRFPINIIILSEGGSAQTDIMLMGCKINKRAIGSSSGSEALSYKYDLSIFYTLVDGIPMITGLRQ